MSIRHFVLKSNISPGRILSSMRGQHTQKRGRTDSKIFCRISVFEGVINCSNVDATGNMHPTCRGGLKQYFSAVPEEITDMRVRLPARCNATTEGRFRLCLTTVCYLPASHAMQYGIGRKQKKCPLNIQGPAGYSTELSEIRLQRGTSPTETKLHYSIRSAD